MSASGIELGIDGRFVSRHQNSYAQLASELLLENYLCLGMYFYRLLKDFTFTFPICSNRPSVLPKWSGIFGGGVEGVFLHLRVLHFAEFGSVYGSSVQHPMCSLIFPYSSFSQWILHLFLYYPEMPPTQPTQGSMCKRDVYCHFGSTHYLK